MSTKPRLSVDIGCDCVRIVYENGRIEILPRAKPDSGGIETYAIGPVEMRKGDLIELVMGSAAEDGA